MIIRSDLASCSTHPEVSLRLYLPHPLEPVIMQVHPLDDLSLYTAEAEAGVTLLEAVRKKLISSPRVRQVSRLVEIACPFAKDLEILKPSPTREFNQYVLFKVSLAMTVNDFIVATMLHPFFMFFLPVYS